MKEKIFEKVSIALAVFLAAATLSGAIFGAASFMRRETQMRPVADSGVTDGAGNELVSGVSYALRSLVYAVPTQESETAAEGITLTVGIEPETATHKQIDWTAEWTDPASAWATGKETREYFTVTPVSDGAAEATAVCLKPFGEQIKIVARSRAYPDISAECTVDYKQKPSGVKCYLGDLELNIGGYTDVDISVNGTAGYGGALRTELSMNPGDVYTIAADAGDYSCEVWLVRSDEGGLAYRPEGMAETYGDLSGGFGWHSSDPSNPYEDFTASYKIGDEGFTFDKENFFGKFNYYLDMGRASYAVLGELDESRIKEYFSELTKNILGDIEIRVTSGDSKTVFKTTLRWTSCDTVVRGLNFPDENRVI